MSSGTRHTGRFHGDYRSTRRYPVDKGQKLSRRDFLRLSAISAAGTLIAACGGAATTPPAGTPAGGAAAPTAAPAGGAAVATVAATTAPIAAPSAFKEAPAIADLVKAGTLPPADQRLPKKPYVPPEPWLTTGKYGGTIQTTANWEWGVQHIMLESQYGHSPLQI